MDITYSTKYSNNEIQQAWNDIKDLESFNIIIFMLIYGDIDELMESENPAQQLKLRKMIDSRISTLKDKLGE